MKILNFVGEDVAKVVL